MQSPSSFLIAVCCSISQIQGHQTCLAMSSHRLQASLHQCSTSMPKSLRAFLVPWCTFCMWHQVCGRQVQNWAVAVQK